MLIIAVLFMAGVLLGEWITISPVIIFTLALVAAGVTLAAVWLGQRCDGAVTQCVGFLDDRLGMASAVADVVRQVALIATIVLVGWANYTQQTAPISPYDLRHLIPDEGAIITLRGELAATPESRRAGVVERTSLRIRAERITRRGRSQSVHGTVMVTTTNRLAENFYAGQIVEVDGVLIQPERAKAPGLYDRRESLRRRGIYFELNTDKLTRWKLIPQSSPPRRPLADRFRAWGRHNLSRGQPEQDEALELLWAMSLGWRTALTGEVAAPFMRSGTMHFFAISGLHIGLVAGIFVILLRVVRVPRGWVGVVAIPLLWFYTAATGWQPSAVRATVMMTLILAAWSLKRPVNILNSLGMAAFLILLWDPQQLFRASFQLSFAVVFSLALVMPPIVDRLQTRVRPDPFLPRELWPRWRRWILEPSYWLVGAVAISFCAWLASLPLIAHYFHLFNPVALLANVPVVACGTLALASCMGSFICGGWLEPLTVLFNHSAWFFMNCMMAISQWTSDLPGAWQYVRAPAPWMMAGWYAVLFGVGTGWFMKPNVRRWALGGGMVFAISLVAAWQTDRQEVRLTMLPEGPMIHVEASAHTSGLLIDTGDAMAVKYSVQRHLQSRGVDALHAVALTHGVGHHVGGFTNLFAAQPLDRVYLSHAKSSSIYQKTVLAELAQHEGLKQVVSAGDTIGPWKVLHPARADDFSRSTDDALVLRGKFHSVRVLLLSDVGPDGCQAMMARDVDLRADIVVAGIPSYGEPLSPGLLRIINPKVIIIHDSKFPIAERAPKELLNRLRASGAQVFSVRDKKGIHLTITPNGWQIEDSIGVLCRSRN